MWLYVFLALVLSQKSPGTDALARQAQDDLRAGRYSEARDKIRQALKTDPRNPALWSYLGLADAYLNQLDSAIDDFQKVISLTPKQPRVYFDLGLLYAHKGDLGKAAEAYRRGLEMDPGDLDATRDYALLLLKSGKFREAVRPLEKLKASSSDPSIQVGLIEAYLRVGRKTEGERQLDDLLSSQVLSAAGKLQLAQSLLANDEPDAAQEVLERVVASLPDSAEAHHQLGMLLSKEDKLQQAAQELVRAAQLAPDSAEYTLDLADVFLRERNYSAALELLINVRNRFGTLPEFQYKLALAHYEMKEFAQAIELLEQLERSQPGNDLTEYYLGNCYGAVGNLKKAEGFYREALRLNPQKASYYGSLGRLLIEKGGARTEEGVRDLEHALELNPEDAASKLELALFYERKGDFRKAMTLLKEVIRRQPAIIAAHVALARLYYRQGKKQEADRERSIITRLEVQEQAKNAQAASTAPAPVRH